MYGERGRRDARGRQGKCRGDEAFAGLAQSRLRGVQPKASPPQWQRAPGKQHSALFSVVRAPGKQHSGCFQWFERPENSTVCCFQRERAGRPTSNGPAGPRRWGRQAHVERAGRPVENGRAQRGIGHPTANICRMAPPSPTDAGHVQLTKSRIATSTPLALSRNGIDRGTMPCPMSNHCGKIPAGPTWQSGFTASKKPEGLQS